MKADAGWTGRVKRATTAAPQPDQHPNSVRRDGGRTLARLERLQADLCRSLGGVSHAHPRYQTSYYNGLVAKMLACGNPKQMGYVEYRCLQCGQGTHRVAMSCKSSLCLRCAKVYVDNWVNQVSKMLHAGSSIGISS